MPADNSVGTFVDVSDEALNLFSANGCAINFFKQIKRTLITDETTIDNQSFAGRRRNFEEQSALIVGKIDFPRRSKNQRLTRREINILDSFFNQVAIFFEFHFNIDAFADIMESIFDGLAEFLRRIVRDNRPDFDFAERHTLLVEQN